jgi:hypothetical protein
MTALGATLYGGFFALAALWLFVTSDGPDEGQSQAPDFSNPVSASDASAGSNPMLATHSSLK